MNYQKIKDIQEIYFSTDRYIFDEDKPSTVDNQEIENLTTKNITIQNKKNFMKSMYEIMNKNLITKSADYHGYENYYELTISFTTKNTINPNRNYIIKDENMAAVLDIFSKYDIIKTNRLGITSTYFYRRSLYEKNLHIYYLLFTYF